MKTKSFESKRLSILIMVALLSAYAFVVMTRNCFSSAMVFIVSEGKLNNFQTGIITAVFYVVYGLAQTVGGFIIDKINPERFVTVGLLGAALSNFVIYFNQNYIVMLLAWSFNAIMQFGVWPAVFKMVSTMPRESMRTGTIFVATLASPISTVAGYGVAAIVGSHWQLNFLISGVGLVTFALTWEIASRLLSPYATVSEPVYESKITVESKESFLRTMIRSGLFVFLAIALFKSLFDYAIKGFSPSIISNMYDDVTTVLATLMNIVILVVGAVGTVSAYFISKHIRNEAVVIAVCFCIAFPLVAFTLLVGKINYWFIVIALSFVAMLMGVCNLYTTTFVAARFNSIGKGATVAGTINCIACMGIVITNTVFPRIADSLGWYAVLVSWVIIMTVAVAFTFVLIPIWTKFLKNR